jgi:hypothetical protein
VDLELPPVPLREREEVRKNGYPEFEVRIECANERDAEAFATEMRFEGRTLLQRHNYVLIGVNDEDEAAELAAQLRDRAPEGATVTAEGTLKSADAERPFNPFSYFGGLGG